jgi:23S rRNA (uracil1939-C5)-methyltransferase
MQSFSHPLPPDPSITLTIDALGIHGEGIGRHNGYTIFVPGALPGETVSVELVDRQRRYGHGKLLAILTPSPSRVEPPCPLFGKCGGCQLMHLGYSGQLQVKRQRVVDALQRIGHFENLHVEPCTPSPQPLAYRNKIQLPVRSTPDGIALGLYAVSSHELVPILSCEIHCTIGQSVYETVRELVIGSGIKPYDPPSRKGVLRHLLIKSAVHTGEVLVILVATTGEKAQFIPLAEKILKHCPAVKGVILNTNTASGNVILGSTYRILAGREYILERLGELVFKVSPASFFQVNPQQAVQLYSKAVEIAGLSGSERVLDAFCGVGTLSLFFARHVHSVVGVECISEAIADAKDNGRLNAIENVSFVCDSSENFIKTLKAIDLAILNPPRKGCDPSLLEALQQLAPKTILYISCDPATLARDLALLCGGRYAVAAVHPFDMFPQTAHVETLVKLERTDYTVKETAL